MSDPGASIRAATPDDADDLAKLIDLAGEGIPGWLWSLEVAQGESPLEVGRRRAAREEGGFSYRNAHVLELGGRVAGMLLGYSLPDPYPQLDVAELPGVVRPLLELEALAPGSWYVNGVAVYEPFQGRGYGKRLMDHAEAVARQSAARRLSLIVAEENERARRLYERLGYREAGRRPIVACPALDYGGDWILMTKRA